MVRNLGDNAPLGEVCLKPLKGIADVVGWIPRRGSLEVYVGLVQRAVRSTVLELRVPSHLGKKAGREPVSELRRKSDTGSATSKTGISL